MNHFERIAIFTTLESIENQLKGLKTLIAASAGTAPGEHKVTRPTESDPFSQELSEEEEVRLEKSLKDAQDAEIARMKGAAEGFFQKEFETVIGGMPKLDGQALNG